MLKPLNEREALRRIIAKHDEWAAQMPQGEFDDPLSDAIDAARQLEKAGMNRCKTCRHWQAPGDRASWNEESMCRPRDPDTFETMRRGFEVRLCKQPTQTFCESPIERDGFGLTDGSQYMAALATAEDFGCVKWEAA